MIHEKRAGANFASWIKSHNDEMLRDSPEFCMGFFSKVNDLFILLLAQRRQYAALFLLEIIY